MKKLFAVTFAIAVCLVTACTTESPMGVDSTARTTANVGQEVCTSNVGGWVFNGAEYVWAVTSDSLLIGEKYDFPDGVEVYNLTVTAPQGYLVSAHCYKAGTAVVTTEVVPANTVTITSDVWNSQGKATLAISHFSVWFIPVVVEPVIEPWCSPGFWKNTRLAWPTGTAPTQLYADALGQQAVRSTKGVRDRASTSPTLRLVLDRPDWYSGETFNLVGDYLTFMAGLQPSVTSVFDIVRNPDSCTLSNR